MACECTHVNNSVKLQPGGATLKAQKAWCAPRHARATGLWARRRERSKLALLSKKKGSCTRARQTMMQEPASSWQIIVCTRKRAAAHANNPGTCSMASHMPLCGVASLAGGAMHPSPCPIPFFVTCRAQRRGLRLVTRGEDGEREERRFDGVLEK